jgi:hypothetical protein
MEPATDRRTLSAVRTLPFLAVLCLLALAGCGGGDAPERSAAATELAALCEGARADVEALGLPSEVGFQVIKPWAERGKRLARDVRKLRGESVLERRHLARLGEQLAAYYAGLRLGYEVYAKTRNAEAYAIAVNRATPYLVTADSLATRLGVPECTVRPFAED